MKAVIVAAVIAASTLAYSSSAFAGGLLGDVANAFVPGAGTALDNTSRTIRNNTSDHGLYNQGMDYFSPGFGNHPMYSAGHGQPVASPVPQPYRQRYGQPYQQVDQSDSDEWGDICETRFGPVQMKWEKPLGDSCRVHVSGRLVQGEVTSTE